MPSPDFTTEELEQEIWKPVPDYPGYEVSNLGRVRSWRSNNPRARRETPRNLRQHALNRQYKGIQVIRDRKAHQTGIHRLVLAAFVGPCPPEMEACHNDGNPSNNRLSNLRWGSRESNWEDRRKHGRARGGELHGRARLTETQVKELRELFAMGLTYPELSDKFGIGKTTVGHIVNGRTWKHVGGPIFHIGKRRNARKIKLAFAQENH